MGTDLTLATRRYATLDYWLAHNRISLDRDYHLFEQIENIGRNTGAQQVCKPHPLIPSVRVDWYKDGGVEEITEDAYGAPLTYLTAGELVLVNTQEASEWNQAVFAFFRALPPEIQVLLYWH